MQRGSRSRTVLVTLLMLLPGLAAFFGLFFYPMMVTVVRSLRPEGEQVGWTLEHYIKFLAEPSARSVIVLTFVLAIGATLASILFRNRHTEQADIPHLLGQRYGELLPFIQIGSHGFDHGLRKLPDRHADHFELVIHVVA